MGDLAQRNLLRYYILTWNCRTCLRKILFLNLLLYQNNPVIAVCTSMGTLQTGTAHSWFAILLNGADLPKCKQIQDKKQGSSCSPHLTGLLTPWQSSTSCLQPQNYVSRSLQKEHDFAPIQSNKRNNNRIIIVFIRLRMTHQHGSYNVWPPALNQHALYPFALMFNVNAFTLLYLVQEKFLWL